MRSAFVTGATGFVGLNLVRQLKADGWEVTALHRESSDLTLLKQFEPKLAVGDVVDAESVLRSMPEVVDAVFHVAASTNMWAVNNDEQTRINVEGARNVVRAAIERKAKKLVHTSTVSAYAPADGDVLQGQPSDRAKRHWINYYRTKWLAEQEVRKGIEQGLDATFINPGNIMGPYDTHSWARAFRLVKDGKLPGVFPGSGPWTHVDNVVAAHIAAVDSGKTGENYLIGDETASYADAIHLIADLTGGSAPTKPVPAPLLQAYARLLHWKSLVTRTEPDVTPEIVHLCITNFSCDCTPAKTDLGYKEVPLRQMVQDSYNWLTANGRL
ncbi:MAG: NAD-dependent epimerase/dehydratase family protein [Planctomycetaceae bacterium]|nr:NAD-dependent epimerase/dehydratase family protein [Planctomycetaceae bacterium]